MPTLVSMAILIASFFLPDSSSLLGQHLGSWSCHAKRCSKGVASSKEVKQHYVFTQE